MPRNLDTLIERIQQSSANILRHKLAFKRTKLDVQTTTCLKMGIVINDTVLPLLTADFFSDGTIEVRFDTQHTQDIEHSINDTQAVRLVVSAICCAVVRYTI